MMAGHCHCEDCRRTSGSTRSSHMAVPEAPVAMSGVVTLYERAADSGNIVARAFCPTCGAPVFSRNVAMPGLIFLRASSLDDLEAFRPTMVVYASRVPSWDTPGPDLPTFANMPPGM